MAVTQNFLIGRTRKSAGGTRFSTWKGLNVIAAKPMQVKQTVTEAVELNRAKMKFASQLVKKLGLFNKKAYNFGIQKTTEFADSVKFYRQFIKDDLTLGFHAMEGKSYGTGNVVGPVDNFNFDSPDECVVTQINGGEDDRFFGKQMEASYAILQEDGEILGVYVNAGNGEDYPLTLVYSKAPTPGKGKKVVGKKIIKFKAGSDLATKVK